LTKKLFLHIGYHKTATTWLQDKVFSCHEQVIFLGKYNACKSEKIFRLLSNFYKHSDTKFSVKENKSLFEEILKENNLEGKKIIGLSDEGLSGGLDWFGGSTHNIVQRIRDTFDEYDVKIIIGIREQKEMLLSLYSEYVKRGGTCSLERLIFSPYSEGRFLFDKLEYFSLLSKYIHMFGKENVFCYLFEEISQDKIFTLNKLFEFLDLGNLTLTKEQNSRVNIKLSNVGLVSLRFMNHFFFSINNNNSYIPPVTPILSFFSWILVKSSPLRFLFPFLKKADKYSYYSFEQLVNNKISSALAAPIIFLDSKLFARFVFFSKKLPKKLEKNLEEKYKSSNSHIEALINKDLSSYGYITEK